MNKKQKYLKAAIYLQSFYNGGIEMTKKEIYIYI